MKAENVYSTKDLAVASLLLASEVKLTQIKDEDNVCWFVFSDGATCKHLADSFWRNQAMVNAREFYNAMRTLKDIIFNRHKR